MKRRATSTELLGERQVARPRQEPVSCKVCRKKKLKCSRTFPCSNCTSRGLACEPPDAPRTSGQTSATVATSTDSNLVLAKVLDRLQRLEDMVLSRDNNGKTTFSPNPDSPALPSPESIAHEDEAQNYVFRSLELSGSRRDGVLEDSDEFLFSSAPITELIDALSSESDHLSASFVGQKLIRPVFLPRRAEAHALLASYSRSLGTWYHILHRSTVETLLNSIYDRFCTGQTSDPRQVALLLSIFGAGAYFCAFASEGNNIFANSDDANQASLYWKRSTLDVLGNIGRNGSETSLEQLQATIIISLLVQNLEGTSRKYRTLHGTAISLARELSLHILDHPRYKGEKNDLVISESKRRAWWYLASTDWLLGSLPSPQEGTYSINPQHAIVNLPMNLDDDVLSLGHKVKDQPLSEPSELSYFIIRAQGAELCRHFADMLNPLAYGVDNVNYDDVVTLENRTRELLGNLPFYLQFDEESRKRTEPYLQRYPQLEIQKFLVHQGLHCHRGRLHRAYLIRGSLDPRYSFSRNACLESVRMSLEIRRMLDREKTGTGLPASRLNFVVHHVFIATLTLALDLCFNKSTDQVEDQMRRAELREACKMIDDARKEVPVADRFLTPLLELLRKHKIQLQDTGPQNTCLTPSDSVATPNRQFIACNTAVEPPQPTIPVPELSNLPFGFDQADQTLFSDPNFDLDSLWQDFIDLPSNANAPDWDNLFTDLDCSGSVFGV